MNKVEHLKLIQAVITRMASNSFLLKGWSVTVVAALFALAAKDANAKPWAVLVAFLPALTFWGLDGFFLWQEKLFRKHYDRVRRVAGDESDFSMDTAGVPDPPTWLGTTFSKTLVPFHGAVIATIIVVACALYGRHLCG